MRRWSRIACMLIGLAAGLPALAADEVETPFGGEDTRDLSWTVHVDNDAFALVDRDRDYTAGFAFSLSGRGAAERARFLSGALSRLDSGLAVGLFEPRGESEGHALEIGVSLFTPQDLRATAPIYDDRPYASLLYVAATNLRDDVARGVAYQSSLTLGVLGLPLAEQLHRTVHDAIGSVVPQGYDHQISAGGEPTFRYTMSRYQLLVRGDYRAWPYSVRLGTDLSIGYVTEVNSEVSVRWGRTRLPWWESLPGSSEYAGHPPIRAPRLRDGARTEVFFDAGAKVRLRLYNSFLQGQFRDSDVEYSSSDLDHVLFEAWIGVTTVIKDRLSVSYTIRHQSGELETGRGARGFTWASIGVAREL